MIGFYQNSNYDNLTFETSDEFLIKFRWHWLSSLNYQTVKCNILQHFRIGNFKRNRYQINIKMVEGLFDWLSVGMKAARLYYANSSNMKFRFLEKYDSIPFKRQQFSSIQIWSFGNLIFNEYWISVWY